MLNDFVVFKGGPRTAVFEELGAFLQQRDPDDSVGVDDTIATPWIWQGAVIGAASSWNEGQLPPLCPCDTNDFRQSMLETAAVALLAIESIDRQRLNGAPFFEQR